MVAKGLEPLTRVAVVHLAGEKVDTDYTDLLAAVTAIGSTTPTDLKITTPNWPNGGNATVTPNIRLLFVGQGSLTISTGQQVTIQSDTSQWPLRKIFNNATAGLGEVLFTNNRKVGLIYPEWWGAEANDSTDCAAAFQAMLHLTEHNGSLNGARCWLSSGTYRIGTALTYLGDFGHSFVLSGATQGEGAANDGPVLKFTGSSGGTLLTLKGANFCNFEHVQFHGNGLALICVDVQYDSGRSMSSFDCTWRHCGFGGATGTDSMLMRWGTSNFASAEHRAIDCRFIFHGSAGDTYYGLGTSGSANTKNHLIQRCRFIGLRYGISFSNSGYHAVVACSFANQTVADILVSSGYVTVRDCGSEGSAKFIDDAGANIDGTLTIEACYWHGVTVNSDFVIEYGGQLTLIGTELYNNRAPVEKTFTADAATDTITATAHGYTNGQRVNLTSTGTLPAGLAASTNYYIVGVATNSFQLATVENGAAIDITSAGSGTHKVFQPTEPAVQVSVGAGNDRGSFVSLNNSYMRPTGSTVPDYVPAYSSSYMSGTARLSSVSPTGDSWFSANNNPGIAATANFLSFGDKTRPGPGGSVDRLFPARFNGRQTYVMGISFTAIESKNLRGQVQVTGTNTSATATFPTSEVDASYYLNITPVAKGGTPAAGANRIVDVTKNAGNFVLNVEAAPGVGNSVTFDWMLVR